MPKAIPHRGLFRTLSAVVGGGLTAAALLALALGAARDLVPLLDLLNIDRWLVLAAGATGLALLAAAAVPGRDIAIGAVLLGLAMLALSRLPGAPTAATGCATPLRIVQWNLRYANAGQARAAAWLRGTDADLLLLQEARGGAGGVRALLAADYPYRLACLARGGCSTVILARRRPDRLQPLARGDAENRRALSAARMDFGHAAIVSLHLSRPWPPGHQLREIGLLEARLGDVDPRWLIIGGDFNSGPAMAPLRRLGDLYDLALVDPGAPSWPAPNAMLRIDHLLVGSGWRVVSARRVAALGSDHHPQLVTLCPAGGLSPIAAAR